jgi:ABC-type uncharacterized transport system ATPase subunit
LDVQSLFTLEKDEAKPTNTSVLEVSGLTVAGHHQHKDSVNNVSFTVRAGEILCVAGIEGNGQSELVFAITGLVKHKREVQSSSMEKIYLKCKQFVSEMSQDCLIFLKIATNMD